MPKTIRAGDAGVAIEIQVKENGGAVDISGATVLQLLLKSPAGILAAKTATFSTNGKDGRIRYVTQAADFSEVGVYGLQARVTIPPSYDAKSSMASLRVEQAIS